MSLWTCPEHGLYGGQWDCPKCGKSGDYATAEPATPILDDTGLVEKLRRTIYANVTDDCVSQYRTFQAATAFTGQQIFCNPDGPEAADRILALSADNARKDAEIERLNILVYSTRAASKARGRDMLREEADAALPFFTETWEPLREVAMRAGAKSAQWLTARARDLQARGLVESKWFGAERTASFKVWRKGPGRLPKGENAAGG